MSSPKETFWWARMPDGRFRLGFGFRLLALVPFAAIMYLLFWPKEPAGTEMHGLGVNAERVAQAVKLTRQVEDPAPESTMKSERDLDAVKEVAQAAVPPASSAPSGLDAGTSNTSLPAPSSSSGNALDRAISQAQVEAEVARENAPDRPILPGSVRLQGAPPVVQSGEDGAGSSGQRPQTGAATSGLHGGVAGLGDEFVDPGASVAGQAHQSGAPGGQNRSAGFTIYRRKAPETKAVAGEKVPAVLPSKWTEGKSLPRGYYVPLYLFDTIRTDSVQPIITFVVARDVKYHDRVIIPMGTKLLASVAGPPALGQRVVATPSSFQFRWTGKELAVSGVIKDADRVTGLVSYYIPPPTWAQMSTFVDDFISGYLALVYDRQQQLHSISVAGVTVGAQQTTFDPKLEAISASSSVVRDFAKSQMAEIQARYAPYMTVPAGIDCLMQITSPLTVTDADYNSAPLPKMEEMKPRVVSQVDGAIDALQGYSDQAKGLLNGGR